MIISVSQQKGGVGKTVSAVMLSQYLSYIRGYKVLLIDLDAQGNATSCFMEKEGLSLKDVMLDQAPLDTIMRKTHIPNLDIIMSDISMEKLETALTIEQSGPFYLKYLIKDAKLRTHYDIILIDTPPHLGRLTQNSLIAADYVLIPLEPKKFAAEGLGNQIMTIEDTQSKEELNPRLRILGGFFNKFESRTVASKDMLAGYQQEVPLLNFELFKNHIRFNIRIEEVIRHRALLYTFDPKSNAAIDFTALGEELLERAAAMGTLLPEPTR